MEHVRFVRILNLTKIKNPIIIITFQDVPSVLRLVDISTREFEIHKYILYFLLGIHVKSTD